MLEGFYTVLQEDFYTAYVNIGDMIRSHRVCPLKAIVTAEESQFASCSLTCLAWQIFLGALASTWSLVSASSTRPSGLTQIIDIYTFPLEVETTGCIVRGPERFLDLQSHRPNRISLSTMTLSHRDALTVQLPWSLSEVAFESRLEMVRAIHLMTFADGR